MHRLKLHTIVSWILLAYFAVFIVPPVSIFAPGERAVPAVPEAGRSLEQDRGAAPLLLFDFILWQTLKKTKHSEEFLASIPVDVDRDTTDTRCAPLVQAPSGSSGFAPFTGRVSLVNGSRSSAIRFTRSGISPPFFS
jgi:hypothetical protein